MRNAELRHGILEDRSGTGPRFTKDPLALHEFGRAEARASDPRVLRPDDYDQLIARDRRACAMLALHRALDESQLRRPGFDRFGDLRRVADCEADRDLGKGPAESNDAAGQPVASDGLARLHRERSALEGAELAQRELGHFSAGENRPGLGEEDPAGL